MRRRQIEIANEWDSIETAFQNDKLWYFLCNRQVRDNRIEFIFNLMNNFSDKDSYSTFRFFNARLASKSEEEMKNTWEEVQGYYQRFNEWFHDRELYHKIGFLLTAEISDIKELYNQSSNLKKSEFVLYINDVIKKHYKSRTLLELSYQYFNKELDSLSVEFDKFRRAMLTIEVSGKYQYYNYWWSYWNAADAEKRKLFPSFREIEYFIGLSEYKAYLKKLILKLTETDYDGILSNFVKPDKMENWQYRLVVEKKLLSNCTSKYIAIAKDRTYCYLMRSKRPSDISGSVKVI